MAASAAAWPARGDETSRPTVISVAAFAAGVLMLLIYSQGWEMPLVGENADPSQSGLVRALYLPSYAISFGLLLLTPMAVARGILRQPFLILLMGVVIASLLWSVSPEQSTRRIFAVTCTTASGVVIAARWRWATLAEVIATAFAVLAILSLLVCLFVPSIGRMTTLFPGAWRGLWPEKNSFAANMAFGFIAAAAAAVLNPKRRYPWSAIAGLCFLLVLASTSKTSLLSLLLGAGAMAFIYMARRGPASSVAATWSAILGVMLIAAFVLLAADVFFGLLGKDATLTGRTKIWAGAYRQIQKEPWLGYGYGAVWDEDGNWGPLAWITKEAGFRAHHAHNSWLEQWLTLGVVGLAAWALFFLQTFIAALVAVYRQVGAYLAFPILVVYALMTLTESIAVTYNDMRWVLFVALAVKLALPDAEDREPVRR